MEPSIAFGPLQKHKSISPCSIYPCQEPGITTILSLSSFLLLLTAVHYVMDCILYCGIISDILIGIICGIPVRGPRGYQKPSKKQYRFLDMQG